VNVTPSSSEENVEHLRDEVESVLHKLESSVAALDERKSWRKMLGSVRRGPLILAGAGVVVMGLLLRRKGKGEGEGQPRKSAGRALAAGSFALVGLLAKRWAKRLWAGRA
jgi:hypothetical protein